MYSVSILRWFIPIAFTLFLWKVYHFSTQSPLSQDCVAVCKPCDLTCKKVFRFWSKPHMHCILNFVTGKSASMQGFFQWPKHVIIWWSYVWIIWWVWENFEFLAGMWIQNYHRGKEPPCTSNLCICCKVLTFSYKFHMFFNTFWPKKKNWITACFYTKVPLPFIEKICKQRRFVNKHNTK